MNTFSLIIPTYNEEKYLPKLLQSVKIQSLQPSEIIVADSQSTDRTRMIAKEYNCKIVSGGIPAVGRNNGAKIASSYILVFMDSDTRLEDKKFFEKAVKSFIKRKFDIAMCFAFNEDGNRFFGHLAVWITNLRKIVDIIASKLFRTVLGGSGWFIMVRKEVFLQKNGFEKTVNYEDTDFIKRVVSSGYKFGVLPYGLYLSGRRYDKMNLPQAFKSFTFLALYKVMIGLKFRNASKILARYSQEKGPLGGSEK